MWPSKPMVRMDDSRIVNGDHVVVDGIAAGGLIEENNILALRMEDYTRKMAVFSEIRTQTVAMSMPSLFCVSVVVFVQT